MSNKKFLFYYIGTFITLCYAITLFDYDISLMIMAVILFVLAGISLILIAIQNKEEK